MFLKVNNWALIKTSRNINWNMEFLNFIQMYKIDGKLCPSIANKMQKIQILYSTLTHNHTTSVCNGCDK